MSSPSSDVILPGNLCIDGKAMSDLTSSGASSVRSELVNNSRQSNRFQLVLQESASPVSCDTDRFLSADKKAQEIATSDSGDSMLDEAPWHDDVTHASSTTEKSSAIPIGLPQAKANIAHIHARHGSFCLPISGSMTACNERASAPTCADIQPRIARPKTFDPTNSAGLHKRNSGSKRFATCSSMVCVPVATGAAEHVLQQREMLFGGGPNTQGLSIVAQQWLKEKQSSITGETCSTLFPDVHSMHQATTSSSFNEPVKQMAFLPTEQEEPRQSFHYSGIPYQEDVWYASYHF
jgi:hypothetical protein